MSTVVGYIDIEIFRCVSEDITTREVVITDTQIKHIMQRHPGDYERFSNYISQAVEAPDYILEANRPNTAFILKAIEERGEKIQLILRLKTSGDPDGYRNSIITFLKIDQRKWDKYLRNKIVLYKRE